MAPNLKRTAGQLLDSWIAVFASIAVMLIVSRTEMAAELHGRINPVVTPITVTSITPTYRYVSDDTPMMPSSVIAGEAVILRECDNPHVTWELQGVTKTYDLDVTLGDSPKDRGLGPTKWEAIVVGIEPERLYQTEGYARHTCGMFPVKSPFYIPDMPGRVSDELIEELGARAECVSGAFSTSSGSGTCSNHGGVKRWLEDNA